MNRHEFYDSLNKYKSLQHYGIIGQKWGMRRWQNADGTFNTEGKIRYFGSKKAQSEINDEKVGGFFTKKNKDYNYYSNKYEDKMIPWDDKLRKKISKSFENDLDYYWSSSLTIDPRFKKFENRRDLNIINDNSENIINILNALKSNDINTYNNIVNNIADSKIKDICKDYANEIYNAEVDRLKNKFYNDVVYQEDDPNTESASSYKVSNDVLDDVLKTKSFNDFKNDMFDNSQDIVQKIKDESIKYNNKVIKERFGSQENFDKMTTDAMIDRHLFYNRPHDKKWDEIADIGLKALNEIDMDGEDYKSNPNSFRDWFMFEDQTFGMPQLAKLYYDGYSKQQINNLIDQVYDNYPTYSNYYESDDKNKQNLSSIAFNIYEGFRDEKAAKNYVDTLFKL